MVMVPCHIEVFLSTLYYYDVFVFFCHLRKGWISLGLKQFKEVREI